MQMNIKGKLSRPEKTAKSPSLDFDLLNQWTVCYQKYSNGVVFSAKALPFGEKNDYC